MLIIPSNMVTLCLQIDVEKFRAPSMKGLHTLTSIQFSLRFLQWIHCEIHDILWIFVDIISWYIFLTFTQPTTRIWWSWLTHLSVIWVARHIITTEIPKSEIWTFGQMHTTLSLNLLLVPQPSWISYPTPRIGLIVRPPVRPSVTKNPASWIHASGSRIMDICIIHICIIDTCIRIKDHMYLHRGYMHHANIHWDQGS